MLSKNLWPTNMLLNRSFSLTLNNVYINQRWTGWPRTESSPLMSHGCVWGRFRFRFVNTTGKKRARNEDDFLVLPVNDSLPIPAQCSGRCEIDHLLWWPCGGAEEAVGFSQVISFRFRLTGVCDKRWEPIGERGPSREWQQNRVQRIEGVGMVDERFR